ncbi:unnamed protein product, partial [Effrenium voratum]
VCYNATIGKSGWQLALSVFSEIPRRSLQRDAISYNSAITGSDWQTGLALAMEAKDLRCADVVTCNSALRSCGAQWHLALRVLSAFVQTVQADVITYNTVISSCEKAGEWQLAWALLATMQAEVLELDVISLSACVSACEAGQQWETALSWMSFCFSTLTASIITCNAAIGACSAAAQWQHALNLFNVHEAVCNHDLVAGMNLGRGGRATQEHHHLQHHR